jgi:LmbE family N-acetylglucosaminyl deacetylase
MKHDLLRLLILGAHPDDAEYHAGGLISIYRKLGHSVKIVSVTNGAAGHHVLPADELATVRYKEAQAVSQLTGAEYEIWDFPDGELQPTLEVRCRIIREIRTFEPDLVLTHRTNDYHPDHRGVGQAVQDASFMVTVPLIAPDVPALRKDPVVAYMADFFSKPVPMTADVVIDVTEEFDNVIAMLACHRSQFFEWLPYNQGILDQVPAVETLRKQWLSQWFGKRAKAVADRFRERIVETYGEERGRQIQYAEAYEISEYASQLDEARRKQFFPSMGEV